MTLKYPVWSGLSYKDEDGAFMRELFAPGGGLSVVGPGVTVPSTHLANYSSVQNCWNAIDEDICSELENGYIARVPCRPYKVNALGAVEKGDGKWRRITDLSRPKVGNLNEFAKHPTKFHFSSVDDAVKFIFKCGPKYVVASKFDIKAAFRHVPINPDHWHLFGFWWDGHYYVDLRMCFGLALAPWVFWRISNYIARTAVNSYDVEHSEPYIDDFLVLSSGVTLEEAMDNAVLDHEQFRACLTDMGWPIAENKVVPPCRDLVFLGIRINIAERQLSLPEGKLHKILELLQVFMDRTTATKREVERLIGKLNFAAKVVKGGRTFLRRMIDLINEYEDHDDVVTLTDEFRADMDWWLRFSSQWNGKAIMIDPTPIGEQRFVTDASNWGCCAVFDQQFFVQPHCQLTAGWHINETECLSVYLAAKRWGSEWANKHLLVESDNMATVSAINKGSLPSRRIMAMLRDLFWLSALHNFHITARHISGVTNRLADAGSRGRIAEMLELDNNLMMVHAPVINVASLEPQSFAL